MEKLMNYMKNVFAPKMNKLAENPWISAIQQSMMTGLPLVLVGSLVTMFSLLKNIFSGFPDISMLSQFSFGLFGIVVAFLLPYFILENKGHSEKKLISGLTSVALFLMLAKPTIDDGNINYVGSRLGAQGMFVAIVGGFFVGAVMNFVSKRSFFSEDSLVPDFVKGWFDSLLPITFILLVGRILTFVLGFDTFDAISELFKPLGRIVNNFWGFIFVCFFNCFIYSFGISGWVTFAATFPIYQANLAENMELVAAGKAATNIALQETLYSLIYIGGTGTTLALAIMMVAMSKSQRLKAIGKAAIAPSIFNINEPLVFGAPIIFNPLLMIPFWICGLVIPALAYAYMYFGFVSIPTEPYLLWYIPYPISSYFATQDFRAIIACIISFAVSWLIYFPFFKVYDQQLVKEEAEIEENN